MRTFAFACAIAVAMAKKKKKHTEPEEEKPRFVPEEVVPEVPEIVEPETPAAPVKRSFTEKLSSFDFYAKNIWIGCYQGLYGMGRLEQRPTDECFGEWIPEKLNQVGSFYKGLKHNFWQTTYEDAMQVAYDQIDLLFLNDEYCLFRKTYWDIRAFCHQSGNCVIKDMFGNLQSNAFSLITQVSQAVAVFKQEKWSDMD